MWEVRRNRSSDASLAQQDNDDAAEGTPPDSPHVRSGVSSFSHVSSPASYQFSRDGDAYDEEGSSWSTDEVPPSLCTSQHACKLSHLGFRTCQLQAKCRICAVAE